MAKHIVEHSESLDQMHVMARYADGVLLSLTVSRDGDVLDDTTGSVELNANEAMALVKFCQVWVQRNTPRE